MRKTDAFRRAAALMAALSITVSLAAPAFAGTYYIDDGDITITKKDDGSQEIKQNGTIIENDDRGEIVITTSNADKTTLESDLEGPAAEDSGFGPVVEDNYQPAPPAQPEDAEEPKDADQPEDAEEPKDADQPEDAEEPKSADQPESAEEPEDADRQESADQQPQQAAPADAAPAAPAPANGFCKNIITVINNAATALKLTLKDVKIDVSDTGDFATSGKAALSVQGKGNVEIELDGKNELKSGYDRAGLEKNTSDSTGTLTLKDDNKDGSLKATGGDSGAGIGGGGQWGDGSGENITITGGSVTATGGKWAAGIGGVGNGKNITINGGTVNATGTDGGAGIGGGSRSSGEAITINGGTVNATGTDGGAGIGGGDEGSGEDITITGGTVNAAGGDYGAGIGGGISGNGKNITITGGTVTAKGRLGGAGIGGGEQGNGEDITITDGTVNAAGGVSGAGIGGGVNGIGSKVTVSGAAQVTANAGKGGDQYGPGATIGDGGTSDTDSEGAFLPGKEIDANIDGLTPGYIHHVIYNEDGSVKREWWEPESARPTPEVPQPTPDGPNAPAEESNEVSLGPPGLHVETLEGDPLPFDARQQGSTLRVTSNNLAARLHGTRQALEALREQGVEQIQFVTTLKTTTLSVAELLAEGGSWFALEHNGLVSRQLSAAQAESLKCRMR